MSRCPLCDKRWDAASRLTEKDVCTCDHRNTPIDLLLEFGGAFDWITPTAGLLKDALGKMDKVEVFDEFGNEIEP